MTTMTVVRAELFEMNTLGKEVTQLGKNDRR